jgi:ATP-dependent DNA helicase RecG
LKNGTALFMTIDELKLLKESEHKVEFKEAHTQFNYNNGRKCLLGYVVALANEKGGKLILGVKENKTGPHKIVGTTAWENQEGKLVEDIYRDKQIRVHAEVLFEKDKRVLIIYIPSRPVGKTLKHEDIPLMRVGEELLPMSDDQLFKILQEQEPDFSAKICEGLKLDDLDAGAIEKMKVKYAEKQKNPSFKTKAVEKVLSDLKLMDHHKLTYAALILLGKRKAIEQYLPQARIIWEFRFTESQIPSDFREDICLPLFIAIDYLWNTINGKNGSVQVRSDAYINTLQVFNEDVIREAVLNAVAHRDYTITSEVVIKQYPKKILINNPGGFPKGVNIDNLLTISSTPRCRLMTEIMEKTGLVERSGQGIDKIFSNTLSEGKPEPSYKDSDMFQVSLKLSGDIEDKAFHLFIKDVQSKRGTDNLLGVEEIISLYKIKLGLFSSVDEGTLNKLEKERLIIREGTHSRRYILPDLYKNLSDREQNIGSRYVISEVRHFLIAIQGRILPIGELEKLLHEVMNRNQIKYLIGKLYEDEIVTSEGAGRGTKYSLNVVIDHLAGDNLINHVISLLVEQYGQKSK